MYLVKITFQSIHEIKKAKIEKLADIYLEALQYARQIGKASTFWMDGKLTTFANAPDPGALEEKHLNDWGLRALNDLREQTGASPKIAILNDHVPKHFPGLNRAKFLVLYANYWDDDEPIRRGTDGFPFPSYQLPLDHGTKHNLACWRDHYRCLMGVWFRSATLEIAAYKQLARPFGELAEEGVEFCRTLEHATQLPTFYYLFRYWGRKESEKNRLCPMCGKAWNLEKPYTWKTKPWEIAFKCDKCRIVSSLAKEYEDERHARIGEYKK